MTRLSFLLLLSCFFLSGAAGLVYETAWTQQLALVFGASEMAVVAVLGGYMGGLALGALAAARWARRIRRPLLVYALLELAIGLAAIAFPCALEWAARLEAAILTRPEIPAESGSLASTAFQLASCLLILLVPTGLMGATLPILARQVVRAEDAIGPRTAMLYAANTAGAALGALLTAFALLPRLGLGRASLVGVALNAACFLFAMGLSRRTAPEAAESAVPHARSGLHWALPLMAVSGAVSLGLEVLWTRLLTHVLGGSIYAFATMLATFLTAIAIGSTAAARFSKTPRSARLGLAFAQLGAALLSLLAFAAADLWPSLLAARPNLSPLAAGALLSAATLLPAALCIGATFPFAVRLVAKGAGDAGPASARVLAWNTVGAVAGAVAAGLVVLPALRFAGALCLAAATSLGLAAVVALAERPRLTAVGVASLAMLGGLLVRSPGTPWRVLRSSALGGDASSAGSDELESGAVQGAVVHYGVGRSATVLLFEQPTGWRINSNGLPESVIQRPGGRRARYATARWLSLLAVAARPEARSMLVVGLGAGTTIDDLPASLESIDVVELEPEMIAANRAVAAERDRDPLRSSRVRVHAGDARSALRLTSQRFDAIVSQPSHPWTAGAAALFTTEFYELVRRRLSADGVFVQWIGIRFVDDALLRSLVATMAETFPHVEVYEPPPGGALLLLGASKPLQMQASAARAVDAAPGPWRDVGVFVGEDVVATRLLDEEGSRQVSRSAALNTDSRNLLQSRSPVVMRRGMSHGDLERFFGPEDALRHPHPEAAGLYLVRRLIDGRSLGRALRLAVALPSAEERRIAFALVDVAAGRGPRAQQALLAIVRPETGGPRLEADLDDLHDEARFALLALLRQHLVEGRVPEAIAGWLETDASAAALVESWRLVAEDRAREVQVLEPSLAALGPRHPMFRNATRLRIAWRLASGDPALAHEGLGLLDPLIALRPTASDLLQRARLGAAAGDSWAALASLDEISGRFFGADSEGGRIVAEAEAVARKLPANPARDAILSRLLAASWPSPRKPPE